MHHGHCIFNLQKANGSYTYYITKKLVNFFVKSTNPFNKTISFRIYPLVFAIGTVCYNLSLCLTGSLTPTPSLSSMEINTSMAETKHTMEYEQSSKDVNFHSTDRESSSKMTTVTSKLMQTSKQSVSAQNITMGTAKQNRTTPFSSSNRSTLPEMDTTRASITNAPTTFSGSYFTYKKGINTTYTT